MNSASMTFKEGTSKMNSTQNPTKNSTQLGLTPWRFGVLLIALGSSSLASCANGATQKEGKDVNQSKQRNIVSYLA
jgi:hypothetical protein